MQQSMESLVRLLESYRGRDKVVSNYRAAQGKNKAKKPQTFHLFRLLLYQMQLSFKAFRSKQLKPFAKIMVRVYVDAITVIYYI